MHCLPYWRLSGYYFFYFAFIGIFLPYFGLYLQSLSFSSWEISVLMSQMQLMRLFGPYLWGVLADRQGQRVPIVRVTGLLSLLVFSAFFFSKSFTALLMAMAMLSFFWAAALPLVETLTFDHLSENAHRYSRIRLWGSVGFTAAVMVAGALLDYLQLPSLLWMAVVTLCGTLLYALVLPEAPLHQQQTEPIPIMAIMRQRRVVTLFSACFMMAAAHGALYIFYSIFVSAHGYSKFFVGSLWSLGVFAEIAAFFFMAKVMQRFNLRTILLWSFFAAVLRFLMIGWGVKFSLVLVFAQLLHGLTFGSFHAAAIAAVSRWFPGQTRTRGQALFSSLTYGGGGLIGGLVGGWTWDHLGGELTFVLSSIYAVVGLVLVARGIRDADIGENTAEQVPGNFDPV